MYKKIYKFIDSDWNSAIAFLWGFAEATVFFIIPDVYITFVFLFSVRSGFIAIIWSIIGSIAGAVCIYLLHMLSYNYASVLVMIPGITLKMITHGLQLFRQDVFPGFSTVPFSGIPYKIYVYSAARFSVPFYLFVVWTVIARIIRYAFPISVILIIQKFCKKNIKKHIRFWLLLFFAVWILFYTWYFFIIYRIY